MNFENWIKEYDESDCAASPIWIWFSKTDNGAKWKNESFLTTYLLANTAVDTKKRNVRKNDAFLIHDEKIVFLAFFTSERNEMKPFPRVRDAQL